MAKRCFFMLFVLSLLIAACQPLPELMVSESPLPAATAIQPAVEPTQPADEGAGDRFVLDRPLIAGAGQVSGSAPEGMAVIVVDVTRMGAELGRATAGSDGRFTVAVAPLEAGVRIGITTDSLGEDTLYDRRWLGPEAQSVPLVGYFLDTSQVKP